jgi:hypothetical protein
MEEQPQRIVPGAPPPTPLSKSQKKKRSKAKPKTGETGTSPNGSSPVGADTSELPDVHESTVVAVQSETSHTLDDSESKPSPIVELISKRLKATAKKVVSILPLSDPAKHAVIRALTDAPLRTGYRLMHLWTPKN